MKIEGPANISYSNVYHYRKVFWLSVLVLTLLVLFRHVLLPVFFGRPFEKVDFSMISSITDNFISALVVFVVTAISLRKLFPHLIEAERINLVEPLDLKLALTKSLHTTREYWYCGHTARWNRCTTIPEMAKAARESRQTRRINLIILDPTSADLCTAYADFQRKFGHKKGAIKTFSSPVIWEIDRVSVELVSTILTCYLWMKKEPLLEIKIGLWNNLSLLRVDATDDAVIITSPDPKRPALEISSGCELYDLYIEDMRIRFERARSLPRPSCSGIEDITEDSIGDLVSELRIDVHLTSAQKREIINNVKNPRDPY